MKFFDIFRPVKSILSTKATGSVQDVSADLQLPDGDSIDTLLKANEKEETEENTNKEIKE